MPNINFLQKKIWPVERIQSHKHTNKQTNKQTDRQTEIVKTEGPIEISLVIFFWIYSSMSGPEK